MTGEINPNTKFKYPEVPPSHNCSLLAESIVKVLNEAVGCIAAGYMDSEDKIILYRAINKSPALYTEYEVKG